MPTVPCLYLEIPGIAPHMQVGRLPRIWGRAFLRSL